MIMSLAISLATVNSLTNPIRHPDLMWSINTLPFHPTTLTILKLHNIIHLNQPNAIQYHTAQTHGNLIILQAIQSITRLSMNDFLSSIDHTPWQDSTPYQEERKKGDR